MVVDKFDDGVCALKHTNIEGKFTMYTWVFGIIITMQLLTFSWLGYLSKEVISLQLDYSATKSLRVEQIKTLNDTNERINKQLEKINEKLDDLGIKFTAHGIGSGSQPKGN